jgi:hypothetical protein
VSQWHGVLSRANEKDGTDAFDERADRPRPCSTGTTTKAADGEAAIEDVSSSSCRNTNDNARTLIMVMDVCVS